MFITFTPVASQNALQSLIVQAFDHIKQEQVSDKGHNTGAEVHDIELQGQMIIE